MKYKLIAPQRLTELKLEEGHSLWYEFSYAEGEIEVRDGVAECNDPTTVEYLKSLGYNLVEEVEPKLLPKLGLARDRVERRPYLESFD